MSIENTVLAEVMILGSATPATLARRLALAEPEVDNALAQLGDLVDRDEVGRWAIRRVAAPEGVAAMPTPGTCVRCGGPAAPSKRAGRDRRTCGDRCAALVSYYRRKAAGS